MSERPALEAAAVAKGYTTGAGTLEVLKELDFAARPGELVAVVGASGVGKSTLLHVLGGIDLPDSGRVLYDGAELPKGEVDLSRFRNRRVGFVFQFHYLLPEFSALENVMMPRIIRAEERGRSEELARALLDEMGLGERLSHRPAALSGGEQQRVAIARAFAAEPRVVLADEPTGNLDTGTGRVVFEAFAERVRARRVTTVIATHNEELARRCDRVLELRSGRLAPV